MPRTFVEASSKVLGQYEEIARSFRRDLEAANKSPNTIDAYMRAVNQFRVFLIERGVPTGITGITREHVQEFLADLRLSFESSSVNTGFSEPAAVLQMAR